MLEFTEYGGDFEERVLISRHQHLCLGLGPAPEIPEHIFDET